MFVGMILYIGDWKIDLDLLIGECIDEVCLKEFGDEGVCVMICDLINVFFLGVVGLEVDV